MRIGVVGGTFDPIHEGHLYIARASRQLLDLDRVLLMVSKTPPHKDKSPVTEAFHRYAMAVLATRKTAEIHVSTLELNRPGPSYTIDTLDKLAGGSHNQFCFIAGSDSLKEIHLWKEYDNLFNRHCLVFVQRPGLEVALNQIGIAPEFQQLFRPIVAGRPADLSPSVAYLTDLDPPPVSSTQLRSVLAAGSSPPEGYLDPYVNQYIRKYRLYGPKKDTEDHL